MIRRSAARRLASPALVLAILVVLAMGAALLVLGTRSPASLAKVVNAMSPDGSADSFDDKRLRALVSSARLFGAVHLAAGLFLGACFRPARRVAARLLGGLPTLLALAASRAGALARRERTAMIALLLITLGAAIARALHLAMPIRGDEAINYMQFARRHLAFALSDYAHPNNHILYTFLAHLSTKLLGGGLLGIRLPVLVVGTALVPMVYVLARAFFRPGAALAGAALAAFQPYLVFYSVCGRGYILLALCFVAALVMARRIVRSPTHGALAVFALACALGFWAIPTMLLAAAGAALWIVGESLLTRHRSTHARLLRRLAGWGAVTLWMILALYTPVFVISGVESVTNNPFVQPMPASEFYPEVVKRSLEFERFLDAGLPRVVAVAMAALALSALILHRRIATHRLPLIVPLAIGAAIVVYAKHSAPYGRVWTYLVPLYCVMAGAGLVAIVQSFRREDRASASTSLASAGAAAAALALPLAVNRAVWSLPEASIFESPREVVDYLHANAKDGDRVLMAWPALPAVEYHALRTSLPSWVIKRPPGGPPFTMVIIDEADLDYFNRKLAFRQVGPIRPEQLTTIMELKGGRLCRLDPPHSPDPPAGAAPAPAGH